MDELTEVFKENFFQSTGRPIQVHLHEEDGDGMQRPKVFESVKGAYITKKETEDLEGGKKTFNVMVLPIQPTVAFIFPGKLRTYAENKTEHLSIYEKRKGFILMMIVSALEIGQLWYFIVGQFQDDIGWKFWKDVWVVGSICFTIPWIYMLIQWKNNDSDLDVGHFINLEETKGAKKTMVYMCAPVASPITIAKAFYCHGTEVLLESIYDMVSTISEMIDPDTWFRAEMANITSQAKIARMDEDGGKKRTREQDYKIYKAKMENLYYTALIAISLTFVYFLTKLLV